VFYSFDLEIPPNTPEDEPVELEANLTWGIITRVEIRFPPGCGGLVRVRIMEHRHQLWPTNPDGWFYGDDETIRWDEYHDLLEMPAIFTLLGYNDDDTFKHIPIVRFEILHPLAAMAKYGVSPGLVSIRHVPLEEL